MRIKQNLIAILATFALFTGFAPRLVAAQISTPVQTVQLNMTVPQSLSFSIAGGPVTFTPSADRKSASGTPFTYSVVWALDSVPAHGGVNVAQYFDSTTALSGAANGGTITNAEVTETLDGVVEGSPCTSSYASELAGIVNGCGQSTEAITSANLVGNSAAHTVLLNISSATPIPPDVYAGTLSLVAFTY